tara:strand:- start:34 stop:342 length:309 start_codon:yes stop_codon:yes gene_type:complete
MLLKMPPKQELNKKRAQKRSQNIKQNKKKLQNSFSLGYILESTYVLHVERSIVAVAHAPRKSLRLKLALVGKTVVASSFVLTAICPLHLDVVVNFAVTVKKV